MKLTQFQSMVRIEYVEGEEATSVVHLPVLTASGVLITGGLNVYWQSAVTELPEPFKYTTDSTGTKGEVQVDLVALLKSLNFPTGTYCLRRATPMDKLLVQPAPNRVLKQEHLDLLYHQLLYIQQELCEVKFIRSEVVRAGTYNGGVIEDPTVTPDPATPNAGDTGDTGDTKPVTPVLPVDTETQAVPTAEHLQTQGYTISYIHNGVPIIFGKAPFKLNIRNQQIDSNGYLTIANTETQLRVSNPSAKFVSYEDAVGKRPLAAELDAAGYTKDAAGKYYAVLPRQQTTVLPSNSPNGRFEEVSKDANGYSIEYTAEADTDAYKWFVRLADPVVETEDKSEGSSTTGATGATGADASTGATETSSEAPKSNEGSTTVTSSESASEPSTETSTEHKEASTGVSSESTASTGTVSSDPADHGAVVKEYVVTSAPTVHYYKEGGVPSNLGYSRDAYGNYPAQGTITKWVVKASSESASSTAPFYVDEHNSVVEWTEKEDTENDETSEREGYWTLKLNEVEDSEPASPTPTARVTDQNAVIEKVPNSGRDTGYSRESYSVQQMQITGYEPNKYGRYDAIAPITKWVAGANTPEWLKNILPQYSDAKDSEVEWVVQTDPDNPSQQGYWAVSKVRVK